MKNLAELLTENINVWSAAEVEKKSGRGRSSAGVSSGKIYGVRKLRKLILELAVLGKLVPQDSNDEPANGFIKRIQAEKIKLITEGKLKKEKPIVPNLDDDKPFPLPKGWEWARFGDALISRDAERVPISSALRQSKKGEFDYYGASGVIDKVDGYLFDKPLLLIGEDGANLLSRSTPIAFIARGKYWVNNHAHVLDGLSESFLRYVELYVNAIDLEQYVTGTAQPKMNQTKMNSIWLGLPPEEEQHRIVAKVDELMALCDQLEQQHSDAQAAHATLVTELLATLTKSENATEFNANWQRIYAHFDVLFTTEASIDALKQTLLQLAVMGKLVPQDPNDEPASELLKRIQVEKDKLIADGKLKKQKPLETISEDKTPFKLPNGWEWARFPELGEFARGKSKHRPRNDPALFNPPIYPLVQTGEVARSDNVINEYHSKYSPTGLQQSRMWCKGTLCITIAANIADSAILGFDACFPDSVVGLSPSKHIDNAKYFLYFMKTARKDLLKFAPATAQKNINLAILESVLIPTPPLGEQHRIVAKVDELIAICDQLKARINQTQTTKRYLADALTQQVVNHHE